MHRALLVCGLLAASGASAEPPRPVQIWLNPGFHSFHFDRDAGLRENNTGFGVEAMLTDEHALMAGTYFNSNDRRSRFGGYQWRPWRWAPAGLQVHAGVALAVLDGYPAMRDGGAFVAVLPLLAVEGRRLGVNFTAFPSLGERVRGAFAIQLKLRVR